MDIRVGFSGTRDGMTEKQKSVFRAYCKAFEEVLHVHITEFHHGDCVGADAEAVDIIREITNAKIVCHPPIDSSKRAFTVFHETREPKEYLERDHTIVDSTDILIATPKGKLNELRSGTWATIRYAIKTNHPVSVIHFDGIKERK